MKVLFRNIFIQVLSLVIIIIIGVGMVYAWSAIDRNTAASGQPLTSTMMQAIIDRVNDALVPTGAVIAFNLTSCPTPGWSEYTPAYGRFIRGIDKSGTAIDPDGQRALGNIQIDAFQGHVHTIRNGGNGLGRPAGGPDDWMYTFNDVVQGASEFVISTPLTDGVNGTPRTANETRSKNVALLYCIKN